MKLGFILKEEREKRGLSMRALCELINIPISVYHGWENGVSPKLTAKNVMYLHKIIKTHDISWAYILGDKN